MARTISLEADLVLDQWDARSARRVLAAFRRSGLSLAAFAREHGLKAQRLSWWRKRLEGGESEARGEERSPVTPLAFIPAVVSGTTPARVIVRLPAGVEVEAAETAAVPVAWVAELARELGRQP